MATEVIIQESSKRPLYRKFVRDGVTGNLEIVYEMIRLIRNSVNYDKALESFIKNKIKDHGLDSHSDIAKQIEVVFDFVKSNVTYLQDIAGRVESLKSARQTLSDGFGDCDDQTVLNATLLGDLGIEDVRVAMARYSKNDTSFGHIYCVCYVKGQRYVLDTTLPNAELNKEVPAVEVKEISVFENVNGLDGFSGFFTGVKHYSRKAAKIATELLPKATVALPLGFVAFNAFNAGASLIDQAGNKTYSLPAVASQINDRLDQIIVDLVQSKIAYDLAKSEALQVAAQLATIDVKSKDAYALSIVGASVKTKLDFINNFPQFANENNIKVVDLDSRMMLFAGLLLTAGVGYLAYKGFKYSRLSSYLENKQ